MSETQENTLRLVKSASEAMTDGMVERMATTGSNVLEVLDRLNEEDTRDAVMSTIDRLTELHRSGALNTLFDLVTLMHAGRSALTDNMVERLVVWAGNHGHQCGQRKLRRSLPAKPAMPCTKLLRKLHK